MPNQSSKKGHEPTRTCVICKKKTNQNSMFRFVLVNGKIVFDRLRQIWWRGSYCCEDLTCVKKLRSNKKMYGKFKPWTS
jgi:hypothetical protein